MTDNKMRIAVVMESRLHSGGGFQQELSTAALLAARQGKHRFVFYTTVKENVTVLKQQGIDARHIHTRSFYHKAVVRLLRCREVFGILKKMGMGQTPFERVLLDDRIDLVYFLSPSWLALSLTRLNYVITIWDVCHRDYPEFPEMSFDREFEDREYFFRNVLPKATAVLTDSAHGKNAIARRYGCDEGRIHVAKFLPSLNVKVEAEVDIKKKYGLSRKYIFYPAQFWPHKNHVYILEALKLLRDQHGVEIDAVFSGSDKGNLNFVLSRARDLGLEKAVRYVGFVPNEEFASFYKNAIALVMPTYLGPTNIPPLEAFALECPVCYSDLPGLRDQVAGAAFLMDLDDPGSLAKHVLTTLHDPKSVGEKVARGKEILTSWTEHDYGAVLEQIFKDYGKLVKCWKHY